MHLNLNQELYNPQLRISQGKGRSSGSNAAVFISMELEWDCAQPLDQQGALTVPKDVMASFPLELPFEYESPVSRNPDLLEKGLTKLKVLVMHLLRRKRSKSSLVQTLRILHSQSSSEESLNRLIRIKSIQKQIKKQDLTQIICEEILTSIFT